ncbi:MAG: hypothetical protein ABSH52_08760 [Terriglobia bacterium]|jgi:alpha-galactosidase
MKALADCTHSKGLKFGIYTAATVKECDGLAGSAGHEDQDAKTYAEWGVDYVKVDWCLTPEYFDSPGPGKGHDSDSYIRPTSLARDLACGFA